MSDQGHSFKSEFPVLEALVQKLGRNGKTSVIEIHNRREGGGKVEDIERFFLADPQDKGSLSLDSFLHSCPGTGSRPL